MNNEALAKKGIQGHHEAAELVMRLLLDDLLFSALAIRSRGVSVFLMLTLIGCSAPSRPL